jgi:predicted RND superfamily exporter protein
VKARIQLLQARLEDGLAVLGRVAHTRPWLTLAAVACVVGSLAAQLPRLTVETRVELYLSESDPIRVEYDAFRRQFGHDEIVLIALQPPEVFDLDFLERLRRLHERLEAELPHLEEVQSLVNARRTRGDGDTLIVDELMEDWPEDEAALSALRAAALASSAYRDLYISSDGRTAGIVVRAQTYADDAELDVLAGFDGAAAAPAGGERPLEFLSSESSRELVYAVWQILDEVPFVDTQLAVSGNPVIMLSVQDYMFRDMGRFTVLAIVVLGGLLGLMFRRISAVVLPLVVVTFALASTLGFMAALGRPITFVTQVLPSFVLAVGVGFSVHVLAIFFQRLDGGDADADAVVGALRHSGPAIVMSALTTAGGMASFLSSNIMPVRDMGIFIPFGALLSATLALTLVPAMLRIARVRPRIRSRADGDPRTEQALEACGRFGVRHARAIVLCSVPIVLAMVAGIPRISQEYDPLEWLPEGDRARVASHFVDRHMGGATSIEIVVDARRQNELYEPAMLRRIEAIQRHIEEDDGGPVKITKTVSLVDVSKEIHQALNEGRREAYVLPDERALVAQEMLLFESAGTDDLEDVTDTGFRLARVTLKGLHDNAAYYSIYLDELRPELEKLAAGAAVTTTGTMMIGATIANLTVTTAFTSYALAFSLITPLMILFIGRLRIGLVSMAPNLSPILIVLGLMGWAGLALDTFTVLVAGVALGLVVDDTLHILNGFRREFAVTGDVEQAVGLTMRTTGRALLFTTLVLVGAFAIYGFSVALSIKTFGLLTALAIALAFGFDLLLSPALLALAYRRRA